MNNDEILAALPDGVGLIMDGDEIVGVGWDDEDIDMNVVNDVLAEAGLPLLKEDSSH